MVKDTYYEVPHYDFFACFLVHFSGPSILCILFSNTATTVWSPKVRGQVSRPYETTGKELLWVYLDLCVLIYEKGKNNIPNWIVESIPWI